MKFIESLFFRNFISFIEEMRVNLKKSFFNWRWILTTIQFLILMNLLSSLEWTFLCNSQFSYCLRKQWVCCAKIFTHPSKRFESKKAILEKGENIFKYFLKIWKFNNMYKILFHMRPFLMLVFYGFYFLRINQFLLYTSRSKN